MATVLYRKHSRFIELGDFPGRAGSIRVKRKMQLPSGIIPGLFCLMLCTAHIMVWAQDRRLVDSLRQVLASDVQDSVKAMANLHLAEQYYLNDPDTALRLCTQASGLAEKAGYISGMADAYGWIGFLYDQKGNDSLALEFHVKSLEIERSRENQEGIAVSLTNIGYIHKKKGNIPLALEYYHEALLIRSRHADPQGYASTLNNIAAIYKQEHDYTRAISYFKECGNILDSVGFQTGYAYTLSNLGVSFAGLDSLPGHLDSALGYHLHSLAVRKEIGDIKGETESLNNIGETYLRLNRTDSATLVLRRALVLAKNLNNDRSLAVAFGHLGRIHYMASRYDSALFFSELSLAHARKTGYPLEIRNSAIALKQVLQAKGRYEEALEMYELYIQMRDSIYNEETQKATIRQQTKYEFEKAQLVKEQEDQERLRLEAASLSRRDNLQYSVVLICLLILGAGLLALGRFSVPVRIAEGLIFFSFLIFFEFLLVLADPYIEGWSGGAPGIKLLFNAGVAALIFPLHSFFENKLKQRISK